MSTKSTIAYGRSFHFYHEVLDEDYVYLELEGTKFEASYNRVMVPIPVHIWEVIRRYPGIDLKYAEKTDAEIRAYVEREVDRRLKQFEEANERSRKFVSLSGSLIFDRADEPREQQIATGVEYYTKVREWLSQNWSTQTGKSKAVKCEGDPGYTALRLKARGETYGEIKETNSPPKMRL